MKACVKGICCILLAAVLSGCGGAERGDMSPVVSGSVDKCRDVYIYAPAVYVIPVAAGQLVALDPLSNDFPVFCEPEAAKTALARNLEQNKLPGEVKEWRIYRVYGSWSDLATPSSAGGYLLSKPAQLIDWVE